MHFFIDSPYKLHLDNALLTMTVDGTLQILKDRWTHNNDCKAMVGIQYTYMSRKNNKPLSLLHPCSSTRIP